MLTSFIKNKYRNKAYSQKISPVNEHLNLYINKAKAVFDLEKILNTENDNTSVSLYYKKSKWFYEFFHNYNNFIHFAISENSRIKPEDYTKHLELISEYFSNNDETIIELSSGRGANTAYLAEKYPLKQFIGLDLTQKPNKHFRKYDNASFFEGDYHDLSQFENDSVSIIFNIEGLCHSKNKEKVFNEVHRILKPGGLFIDFDGYAKKRLSEITESEKLAYTLTLKGMAMDEIEYIGDLHEKINQAGFSIIKEVDYSKHIIPNAKKFEFLARAFFKHRSLARIFTALFSIHGTKNALSGLFLRTILEREIGGYFMHVFQKDQAG